MKDVSQTSIFWTIQRWKILETLYLISLICLAKLNGSVTWKEISFFFINVPVSQYVWKPNTSKLLWRSLPNLVQSLLIFGMNWTPFLITHTDTCYSTPLLGGFGLVRYCVSTAHNIFLDDQMLVMHFVEKIAWIQTKWKQKGNKITSKNVNLKLINTDGVCHMCLYVGVYL